MLPINACVQGVFSWLDCVSVCLNNALLRQAMCMECLVGAYASSTGMTSCDLCLPGSFTSTVGQVRAPGIDFA